MFTVYPIGKLATHFDDREIAIQFANTCGSNTSVWDENNDCEIYRVY